jgi:molecular chaperone DnaJ
MDVSDIFSMFNDIFGGGNGGGGRGGRGRGPARGYDLETEVIISLEDVYRGCERDVEFTRMDVCEKCTGTGAKAGSKPAKCPTCGGQGRVQQTGLGGMFRMVVACPACGGRGQIVTDFCDACRGKGRTPRKRKLSIKIPPGIADGQAMALQGEGEPPPQETSPGGQGVRGDLHVVIRTKSHSLYHREGDHLILEMPISFSQAALGAEVQTPTLDGNKTLTVPKGTQHGDRKHAFRREHDREVAGAKHRVDADDHANGDAKGRKATGVEGEGELSPLHQSAHFQRSGRHAVRPGHRP